MNWKPQDWVEHASFGLGCVNENRGDRLDIDFINSGSKTILRTTELKAAVPPPDFESVPVKSKSRSPRIQGRRLTSLGVKRRASRLPILARGRLI